MLLNHWWEQRQWPNKMTEARVASIYKKRDAQHPENYRPLSLLNTLFKTLAAVMKARIEEQVEGGQEEDEEEKEESSCCYQP